MKKLLLISWLVVIATGISFLFWRNEWQYSLPTPVPKNYQAVNTGTYINIKDIPGLGHERKPLFLHFFNPDCPCSRFNITHFKSLAKQYKNEVNFAVIVLNENSDYTVQDIQQKFGLTIPVLFDSSIAAACGVYSTPQAAIINTDHILYYRGNYNKTRYCTDKKSNYAQMALDSMLHQSKKPWFGELATKSYGCQLPTCKK